MKLSSKEAKQICKALGRNCRRIRNQQNLSQEELAGRVGISQQYLSGLENGVRNPTAVILVILAKRLGVPVAELLALEDPAT